MRSEAVLGGDSAFVTPNREGIRTLLDVGGDEETHLATGFRRVDLVNNGAESARKAKGSRRRVGPGAINRKTTPRPWRVVPCSPNQ